MEKLRYINVCLYMNNDNICSERLNINKCLLILYSPIIILKLVIVNKFYTIFRSDCTEKEQAFRGLVTQARPLEVPEKSRSDQALRKHSPNSSDS